VLYASEGVIMPPCLPCLWYMFAQMHIVCANLASRRSTCHAMHVELARLV